MNNKTDLIHPHHCFCEIPDDELRPWVDKRYRENRSTIELIHSTDDPHQKEIISIVALLDVDDESLLNLMKDVDWPDQHIIHCREDVRKMLGVA